MRAGRTARAFCVIATLAAPVSGLAAGITDNPAYVNMIARDFAPEATFAFVEQAEAMGDPDAAIAALDQLLLRYPDNVQAHAKISALYAESGNEALADLHRDMAGLPPRTQVWGRATIGVAHESNPSAAPSQGTVQIFDPASNNFIRVASGARRSDEALTTSLNLNLAHGLSDRALLAAELLLETETYSATEELNSVLMEFVVGPWISAPSIGEGASVRPFMLIGSGMLDSSPYFGQIGAGLGVNVPLSPTLSFLVSGDVGYTDYSGEISPNFDANELDNLQPRLGGQVRGVVDDIALAAYFFGGYAFAEADEESYASIRTGAFASTPVTWVDGLTDNPLIFNLGASLDWFAYQEPDPRIDPNEERRDLWIGTDAALTMVFDEGFDLTVGVDYIRRFSNTDVFDSESYRVYFEAGIDF